MLTRFAPTPSGYLHAGNLVNLLLASWLRDIHDGQLALRIDDEDRDRQRPEYVVDIFDAMTWLNISWDIGPRSADSLRDQNPAARQSHWREQVLELRERDGARTFVWCCSRRELQAAARLRCLRRCDQRNLTLETGNTSLRFRLPDDLAHLGEPVLWRRDGWPAYHLASVLTDDELQVTHVLRGEDLQEATQIHLALADALGARNAASAHYLHHQLLLDDSGIKLSKSTLGQGKPLPRTTEQVSYVTNSAIRIGAPLGIQPTIKAHMSG